MLHKGQGQEQGPEAASHKGFRLCFLKGHTASAEVLLSLTWLDTSTTITKATPAPTAPTAAAAAAGTATARATT